MAKYNVKRANKDDIEKALGIVATALGIDKARLRAGLLGSTETTLAGKKADSGDIDIAMSLADISLEDADSKMLAATSGEGSMNKGTKIGSYAVDVGNKKVQVDLMFVDDKEWAKFIYHSAHGRGSNYPGVVRNKLLMAAVRYTHEGGKDMVIKDKDRVIARASRAIKLDVGLERLFKMASKSPRTGKWSRSMDKVDPAQLQKHADALAGRAVSFSHDPDIISDPDKVAEFIFGKGTKAADLMTAEQVIEKIKHLKNAAEILKAARNDLELAALPIPKELP